MRLYAKPGLQLRDPRTRARIGADGVEVSPTGDFDLHRMLAQGDLTMTPHAAPAEAEAPAPQTEAH